MEGLEGFARRQRWNVSVKAESQIGSFEQHRRIDELTQLIGTMLLYHIE